MANPIVAYSGDENASDDAQSQGKKITPHSSLTLLPQDTPSVDPHDPQSPLPLYATGELFTPSLSSPPLETPNPNHPFSSPLSPIEKLIPTTTTSPSLTPPNPDTQSPTITTSPPPLPTQPLKQDLDDVPLAFYIIRNKNDPTKILFSNKNPFTNHLLKVQVRQK